MADNVSYRFYKYIMYYTIDTIKDMCLIVHTRHAREFGMDAYSRFFFQYGPGAKSIETKKCKWYNEQMVPSRNVIHTSL